MIDFEKNICLENDRVKLTSLQEDDYSKLVHFAFGQPELWQYSLIQANSEEKMKRYLALAVQGRINRNAYPFLVFDKLLNQYAGSTRFYDIQPEHATLQLGYTWYGKEFQGTGLNKNCKYLLLEFAFETLQMARVEFRADAENQRSIRAMKSIGCVEEGILRCNSFRPDGSRRSSLVLSILKEEWESKVKPLLLHHIKQF